MCRMKLGPQDGDTDHVVSTQLHESGLCDASHSRAAESDPCYADLIVL